MATGGGKRGYISQFFSDRVFVACLGVDFFRVPELLIARDTDRFRAPALPCMVPLFVFRTDPLSIL